MKKLGKILFPEMYAPAGKEVNVSNSVEALDFFEDFYPKGGIVLLGNIYFESKNLPSLMVWLYLDLNGDDPKLISTIPVFAVPMEELNDLKVLKIVPQENEVFSIWKGELYSSVFTTKGEICIKKVRLLLNANEAAQVYEMQTGKKVEDIYPVELYSQTEHKFIGVCWAVLMVEDTESVFWYPVCLEEETAIAAYPADDLTDHFINPGETAVIAGDTYRLCYKNDTEGFVFNKQRSKEELQELFNKQIEIRTKAAALRAKENDDSKKECSFVPFVSKK